MNKTTKPLTDIEYKKVMELINIGFWYKDADGVDHYFRHSDRLIAILQVEVISGIRISDVLKLRLCDMPLNGISHRSFNITEQKTGKKRNFEIPEPLYKMLADYAKKHDIKDDELLFPISERAVTKQLKIVGDYANMPNLGTHSFRKRAATNIYINSGYDLLATSAFLQHSSPQTTLRYLEADNARVIELVNSLAKDIIATA